MRDGDLDSRTPATIAFYISGHGFGHAARAVELIRTLLDAHPDLYDDFQGNRYSHASPFARIMEEKLVRRLVQVGIRTMNDHQRAQAARFGVEIFEMKDWRDSVALSFDSPVYLSIDLDGIDRNILAPLE